MLFIIVAFYIIIINLSSLAAIDNVGSCLFYEQENVPHKCWTPREISLLRARKLFEQIIPTRVDLDKIDTKYIKDMLKYYHRSLREVEKMRNDDTQKILQAALVDTIGAHLRSELLPAVRFAYYAGFIHYRDVRNLHDFYDGLKVKLNTQGHGWKKAAEVPPQANLTVAKILVGSSSFFDPCKLLIVTRDADSCLHLPMPKVDDKTNPSSIALPLRNSELVSMTSPLAEGILLKYYQIAARCILHSSPLKCRHADFVNYNNDIWDWLQEHVRPHLVDEKLYAAYGGVLRIVAAVQTYGKDLFRRNLQQKGQPTGKTPNWSPNVMTSNTVKEYSGDGWVVMDYVYYVIFVAILIVIIQLVYHNICAAGQGCKCDQIFVPSVSKEFQKSQHGSQQQVAYSDVEMLIPALVPPSRERNAQSERAGKAKSHASSIHTQRVYDFNENREKMMAFIDESDAGSLTSETDNSRSPRRNDTPAQLKVEKTRQVKPNTVAYSNSSTESTYRPPHYESRSGSSSSTGSGSSVMSNPQQVRASSSRDLAWARRVVRSQMSRQRNRSDENICSSYTTLASKT